MLRCDYDGRYFTSAKRMPSFKQSSLLRRPRAATAALMLLGMVAISPVRAEAGAGLSSAPATNSVQTPVQHLGGGLYTLPRLIELALQQNRGLAASRAQLERAQAGVRTAGALHNPEIEFMAGPQRARTPNGVPGDTQSITLTQRLDLPPLRQARIGAARSALDAEQAQVQADERELIRKVKLRYYELVRRQAELDAAEQDMVTSSQIQEKVALRVGTGEAPRYELIKADAESLNAQKLVQGARLRLQLAANILRQAVGADLPSALEVLPPTDTPPELPPLAQLQQLALQSNPELLRDRALSQRARSQLSLEKSARLPTVALKAGLDQDPEVRSQRVGVVLSIPILDRRVGPVGEAAAELKRAQLQAQERELNLKLALEAAYRQVEISRNQVTALESGILRQAEAALRVAEAAYRYGERGILDYLDAQRVYRVARNELIAARFDLRAALIEIERLQSP